MKATLTFDLPEENEEHMNAVQGGSYKAALSELDQRLRAKTKHSEDPSPVYDEVRDWLHEIMGDYGVGLY